MHGHGVNLSVIGFVSAVPPLAGVVGMTYLSRRSDKMDERVWHTVACMLLAAAGFGMVATSHSAATALVGFMLANIGVYSSLAIFWSIPQTYLSAKVRPAAIALISSFGALFGGWLAPIYIGKAQGYFHSLPMGMAIVAALMLVSSLCVGGAGARLARA
jgi:ACS family tartrate transporter-like MFS transporter